MPPRKNSLNLAENIWRRTKHHGKSNFATNCRRHWSEKYSVASLKKKRSNDEPPDNGEMISRSRGPSGLQRRRRIHVVQGRIHHALQYSLCRGIGRRHYGRANRGAFGQPRYSVFVTGYSAERR